MVCLAMLIGCRGADEAEAGRLCRRAEDLRQTDPRAALELKRRIWEQMPTAGTIAAKRCGRTIREKMGDVRALVSRDETGREDTVDGCAWAAMATEVFENSASPPFRVHWANRLMERCITVVGRAWTRNPDSTRYAELTALLKQQSEE